jgi:hypothetical protein
MPDDELDKKFNQFLQKGGTGKPIQALKRNKTQSINEPCIISYPDFWDRNLFQFLLMEEDKTMKWRLLCSS